MARQRPNRRALKTSLRNLFRRHHVRGIEHYGRLLRQTLAELAPPGVSDPCIVLLTPGVYNSAFYEHMFLAQEMGVELVQGSDLRVHNGFVYMPITAMSASPWAATMPMQRRRGVRYSAVGAPGSKCG